ncbi:DUF2254 domain-containing protein [soil metagenome]
MTVSSARRGRWALITEAIESRLWPLPVAAIVLSVVLGLVVPRLDVLLDAELPAAVDSAVFNGGAETARSVLSSIAGSLITATSLTFSLTVVALQLASSQASPRVLRLFARDRRVHVTLAVFLGTFAYAVSVLRSVREATDDVPEFVPRIAVTAGFVLTLVSVVMLVFFLSHLATQLRVETILKDIHAETDRTIRLVADMHAASPPYLLPFDVPEGKATVIAERSGFITSCNRGALLSFAAAHGVVIEETKRVGESIVAGTPQAHWWSTDPAGPTVDPEAVDRAVRDAYSIGYERTAAQDVNYGVQQVLDIAVRALSPGVNDPTTAVHALGHLSALVNRIVALPPLPAGLAGEDGQLRLVTTSQALGELVEDSLAPVRHHGGDDPSVVIRFLQLVSDLAFVSTESEVRRALARQLSALEAQLLANSRDPSSAAHMLILTRALHEQISGSPE